MVQTFGQPVEVGSLSHYLQGFMHRRWLAGILSHQQYVKIAGPSSVALMAVESLAWGL